MIIFVVVRVNNPEYGYEPNRNVKAFVSQRNAIDYARMLGDGDRVQQIDHLCSYELDVVYLISTEE